MSTQRSPNFPQRTTMARSPGEQRFTTAASMAPVPEAARTITSLVVSHSRATPARPRRKSASNSGVRWWRMGRDTAWSTSGGIGVGPGARRWYFFMASPSGRPLIGEGVRRAEDAPIGDDGGDEAGGRHVEGRVPGGRRGRDEAAARPPLGLARVALLGGDGRAPPGRRGGGREGGRGVVGEALG